MDKNEVIRIIAEERRVEQIVQNICKRTDMPELDDLAQMMYEILLRYDDRLILDLWEHEQINFFIVRIIKTMWESPRSTFNLIFKKYKIKACDIIGRDFEDGK